MNIIMNKLAVAYGGYNTVEAKTYVFHKTAKDTGLVEKIGYETFDDNTLCCIDFAGSKDKIIKTLSMIIREYGVPNIVLKPYKNNIIRRIRHQNKNLGRTTKDVYKTFLKQLSMEYSFNNHKDFMEIIKSQHGN